MRRIVLLVVLCLLSPGIVGCSREGSGPVPVAEPGKPVATAADVRFSLPTPHRVVVERRTAGGWGDPRLVFEDRGRECGAVDAIAGGTTVAATVACDEHYAVDQAPAGSVALVSPDGRAWSHRDLTGEASGTPGLSPGGGHAVWVHGTGLLRWDDGSFREASRPAGAAQLVTVDDLGTVLGVGVRVTSGRCALELRSSDEVVRAAVPVARRDVLPCDEVGLALAAPGRIHGEVAGQPGTAFVVRRAAGGWALTARPPVAAPGLDVYSDDPARAIWNQVAANAQGDLVAVGSPDRQHVTAQRYDPGQQRWTRSRVVHDAGAPVCRRRNDDSGVLQGATFRLRLTCDGRPVVLRSRTGAAWSTEDGRFATDR